MTRMWLRSCTALLGIFSLTWGIVAADPDPTPEKPKQPVTTAAQPDLSEYCTLAKAITTRISKAGPATPGQVGYLGVYVTLDKDGKLLIDQVEEASPAEKAGLQRGTKLLQLEGESIADVARFRELLQSRSPGDTIKLGTLREDKPAEVSVTLGAVSRPMKADGQRAVLGVRVGDPKEGDGALLEQVTPDSAAAKAGLKAGDVILKIDGATLTTASKLGDSLSAKKPGDVVLVVYRRDGKDMESKIELGAESIRGGRPAGWDTRVAGYWKKDVYRLAVVPIEYPDVKHNEKITDEDWEESLFSTGTYVNKKSATGQPVHGSLNDYYQEQSYKHLRVEGKVFEWVEVGKKRADYATSTGNNRTALLTEALDKLLAREGKEALKEFDGIFFLYAGDRFRTNRGGLYWPHRATMNHHGKRWNYFITNEGGGRMSNISVIAHEFGHMLGLPDLYARPENPGSEGVGVWCAMSNENGNGRPQHFCAWSKEQLTWVKPALVDPTVKQKLILAPIEDSPNECLKVLVKLDGSEYYLLENRRKKGFDQDLPAEGLLIWRVVQNRPILEESHGVEGPAGPRVFLGAIPYPSPANNAFTPYTTPSSRSQLGGGLPVHITNIRRLADGRVTFHMGYDYQ